MLKEAKEAIVMGQADQNVKQYATLVTEDIDHDGIEKACRKLKLI